MPITGLLRSASLSRQSDDAETVAPLVGTADVILARIKTPLPDVDLLRSRMTVNHRPVP